MSGLKKSILHISGDFHVINGILQTAHSLFKKYRYEFKSNELWLEIKFVLEKLARPLTDLLVVRDRRNGDYCMHLTHCVYVGYNKLGSDPCKRCERPENHLQLPRPCFQGVLLLKFPRFARIF